jgi:hypothetical protein
MLPKKYRLLRLAEEPHLETIRRNDQNKKDKSAAAAKQLCRYALPPTKVVRPPLRQLCMDRARSPRSGQKTVAPGVSLGNELQC